MSQAAKQGIKILEFAGKDGAYKRRASTFRSAVSSKPGSQFTAEAGRYHVYISLACPWAHRVLIYLQTKGLIKNFNPVDSTVSKDSIIGLSVVHWHMDSKGWRFPSSDDKCDAATEEPLYGFKRISELYFKADPNYEGRFTVPVFWDKKTQTIVNNESSEIIRFLNAEFNDLIEDPSQKALNYLPNDLIPKIDELNELIYENINNAVYKSGFASKQEVYETEVKNLFEHLDKVEAILKKNNSNGIKYLLNNELTEADVRLFTTIIRFDPVYVQHFKCNIGMIRFDYPHLHKWVREIYWNEPLIKDTCNFDHIKFHYTKSHVAINPHGITPLGPVPNILPLK
ncbi:omega-class glutathione transferase [Cyberlindnera jadinii NRRL Y-1542]|uniref:Extracellular matrix protein 4 n=1 Tax=Cyberlindnera jadinii (strain ATCC 18201 / CBS 1600 / BCRC 20928 / JCM 3617 / NBRC 0987 / NRRL Y-1542) TaxID=983966 RepID=A0A1E4S5L8_CYBJN|nr:extracellular matrix protein 4 [Cyberlindnera jadinii NRRL Y-1542]ODV74791.1 extracellular matrix protein 4 [Cyberlindnera jadinii NRRL Y-1542]